MDTLVVTLAEKASVFLEFRVLSCGTILLKNKKCGRCCRVIRVKTAEIRNMTNRKFKIFFEVMRVNREPPDNRIIIITLTGRYLGTGIIVTLELRLL
jgi:hypothetical protein